VIRLDAATVLLQWSVGVLAWLWVTSRRREVSLGYGWLLRAVGIAFAVMAVAVAGITGRSWVRDIAGGLVAVAAAGALVVSVMRRKAGVRAQRETIERRQARTFERTGIERNYDGPDRDAPEFPPALDLIAPAIGVVALVAAAIHAGGPPTLSIARTLVGAVFLGAITDAMLLGHWYLTQPGLGRGPISELVQLTLYVWPAEVVVMLIPTGMISVITGGIDDHYSGLLGWMWIACAVFTGALVYVTKLALKERAYSAVMAATGLLYLAILTAFGTDIIARALLSG
jgi:hypothetical protein